MKSRPATVLFESKTGGGVTGILRNICSAAIIVVFLSGFASVRRPSATSRVAAEPTPKRQIEYPESLRRTYLYIDGIKSLELHGDTLQAERLWREAIACDSMYAPAMYRLSMLAADRDSLAEAEELARRTYMADTMNRWYAQLYGRMLLSNERYDLALPIYRRLTAIDSREPENYRLLALLYARGGLPFSAIATLDTAEIRFGRHRVLSDLKQQLLFSTGQTDKAVDEARRSVESFPYDVEAYISLGEAYAATGRDSLALATLNEAFKIDSTDLRLMQALGTFYEKHRRYRDYLGIERRLFADDRIPVESKIKRFEQLTSSIDFYREHYFQLNDLASTLAVKYPDNRDVVDLYGGHLIASGSTETALEYYRRHIDRDDPDLDTYLTIMQLESYLGQTDSLAADLDRAIARFPDNPTLLTNLGHLRGSDNRYSEAVKYYREALRHADNDTLRSDLWAYIGEVYHMQGDLRRTFKAYDKSLRYFADNIMVLNNYAYFLTIADKELDKAFSMASRVMALESGNPTYIDTYAWVLYKLGRLEEAKRAMQQALSLDRRQSASLAAHYGDILWDLGERFMAETYWKRAVERGFDKEEMATHIEMMKNRSSAEGDKQR